MFSLFWTKCDKKHVFCDFLKNIEFCFKFNILPHKVKNTVCDILAIFGSFTWKDTLKYVLSDGNNNFWKIFLKS